jgi:hypothetical protein
MKFLNLIVLFTFFSTPVFSELSSESEIYSQLRVERLTRLSTEIQNLESKREDYHRKLRRERDIVKKLKIEAELASLNSSILTKQDQFVEAATNKSLVSNDAASSGPRDLMGELQDILEPAFSSIKRLSERPRKIEGLKASIQLARERLENLIEINKALANVSKLESSAAFLSTLQLMSQEVGQRIKDKQVEIEDLQFHLLNEQQAKGSVFEEISRLTFTFLKREGKNLFLALLAFSLLFWFISYWKKALIGFVIRQIHRKTNTSPTWMYRPAQIFYTLFALMLSVFFALLVLYSLNDWVLVTFIIIIFFGVFWGTKQYFPSFVEQIKLMLNIGPVREGERVVFNNLPWLVKSLGFYCQLVNPALSGGVLRINAKTLMEYYSRPVSEKEPWFPTQKEDWVELSDGTIGKVVTQTPELVTIKRVGSENKYYKIGQFLELSPQNISQGFSVEFIFGVDYLHQKVLFSEVIPNFKEGIKKILAESFADKLEMFKDFMIDFHSAGESSLNLRFFIRCDGQLASQKRSLTRKMQAAMVEICNEHNYIIPFNQLTVHMPK